MQLDSLRMAVPDPKNVIVASADPGECGSLEIPHDLPLLLRCRGIFPREADAAGRVSPVVRKHVDDLSRLAEFSSEHFRSGGGRGRPVDGDMMFST